VGKERPEDFESWHGGKSEGKRDDERRFRIIQEVEFHSWQVFTLPIVMGICVYTGVA